jgi:hypothetical protein
MVKTPPQNLLWQVFLRRGDFSIESAADGKVVIRAADRRLLVQPDIKKIASDEQIPAGDKDDSRGQARECVAPGY